MKNTFLLPLIGIILFACQEDRVNPPFNTTEFYENHAVANWTRETAIVHLQGRWKLVHTYCCSMATNLAWQKAEDDDFHLAFEGDSVSVFVDKLLKQTEYWELADGYESTFHFKTAKPIANTFGSIYFSKEYMLFNGSPTDGPDSYFEKMK